MTPCEGNDFSLPTCHPQMPVAREAYFARFTPATMAMMCEAVGLGLKLGNMAHAGDGMLWSAVRTMERGEAECAVLRGLGVEQLESDVAELYRPLAHPVTLDRVEKRWGMNLPVVLPPRCRPDERRLDFRRAVTPGVFLAEDLAKFDYGHATNYPLRRARLDVPTVCAALAADGFVPGLTLTARGAIPDSARALYHRACEKAAFVGTWLVRDLHVAAALDELGGAASGELLRKWQREVEFARRHVSAGGCVFLLAFPGPRPWAPSACSLLGTPCGAEGVVQSVCPE